MVVGENDVKLIFCKEDLTNKMMLMERSKENDAVSHVDILDETISDKWRLLNWNCPQQISQNLGRQATKSKVIENEFTEVEVGYIM